VVIARELQPKCKGPVIVKPYKRDERVLLLTIVLSNLLYEVMFSTQYTFRNP